RRALRSDHRCRFRRSSHVRRNVELDANGQNKRRTQSSCRSEASLHLGPDESDHSWRDGELRVAGRCHYSRTQKHDRLRWSARHQRDHASGLAREISDCRVSRRARFDRHDCAPQENARADQPIAQLLHCRAVNRVGGSRARGTGKPVRVGSSEDAATNYRDALSWLYSLQRFGIKLGLENIERLLDELSKSDVLQAAPWKVIHVAGTNGKGSVCAMVDSICRAQGYRTGLFTSPHLVTFRERIRVNGDMISEEAVVDDLT